MDDNTQDPGTSTSGEQAQTPSLQLSDLVLALQTIQASAQRGAVRADEMEIVGGLYNRLFAFLEAQGAIKRPDQGAANA
jgi:hypothetical protein